MQANIARRAHETQRDRPWIFGILIAPSAVTANGVIQGGALGYLLSLQHVTSGTQSHLIGLLALPTSLYFLWSPITDFFVRRRTWLLAGGLLAAVFMAVAFQQPTLSSFAALSLMLISACCSQLVVSSCGGMMGALQSGHTRRVAASIYQAGSMGFGALAAWLLIYYSSRISQSALGFLAAALIGIPALAALAAPRQQELTSDRLGPTMRRVWDEFKTTFLRWDALPYIACMTFPMASGAAVALLPGVARRYGVDGDHVAWVNGLLGGVMMAAGSAAMALVRTRMRVPVLYMVVALVNCACMAVLWIGPPSPETYYLGILLYLFTVGSCYGVFTAVVLEFLGDSGKSGSGRYSIINSLGNIPVLYMLQVDGWGADRWGARGLAGVEAVVGAIGAVLLLAFFLIRGPARRSIVSMPQVAGNRF
ncbi:MAG TPA: MFS transporter [Steroidobacteraceae bacterium]|nr:MFS transporter [Steroidobacteraceae bacterium]